MSESLKINLNSSGKYAIKFGLVLRSCLILFPLLGLAVFAVDIFKESPLFASLCFAVCPAMFVIFFKILNTAFFKEYIIVTKNDISLFHKNLSGTKKYEFELNDIKYFGFADQQYTKHPMDNPVLDVTGLATRERELQYIIDEGNIKIETEDRMIKFGKNLPSWDVEELVENIERFTGRKFSSPKPTTSANDLYETDESETEIISEMPKEITDSNLTRHAYECSEGELIIEQKDDLPHADDKAYLNGRIALTGKYQIGEKHFVFVSNGIIYAIRK